MSDLETRLREAHAYVCASDGDIGDDDGEQLECGADERDRHEAGVCSAWDAIREAAAIGAAAERAQIVAYLEKCAAHCNSGFCSCNGCGCERAAGRIEDGLHVKGAVK